jgi:site-specific recombinase XerD
MPTAREEEGTCAAAHGSRHGWINIRHPPNRNIRNCRAWCGLHELHGGHQPPQSQVMTNLPEVPQLPSDHLVPFTGQLRLAVAAYLARFTGSSREHTESDLRSYLTWCASRGLDPLAAQRAHLELYLRWMQEVRRFKPSTISRRFSVKAGFYRTCVIDGVLENSPADHVRRPTVPAESPTLGFTHLQFEALLTTARQSPHRCDFALVAMLGLLALRIFEATSANITDLGEEHGHRILRVCGKGTKVVLIPLPPAVGRAIDQAISGRTSGPILLNSRGARMDRHAATRRLPTPRPLPTPAAPADPRLVAWLRKMWPVIWADASAFSARWVLIRIPDQLRSGREGGHEAGRGEGHGSVPHPGRAAGNGAIASGQPRLTRRRLGEVLHRWEGRAGYPPL